MPDKSEDSDVRDCAVKLSDDHGLEHSVRIHQDFVCQLPFGAINFTPMA